MNSRNNRILDWVIGKVQLEYGDDVCLLVVYGSHINATEGPLSDVDFYFIPKSDRASELTRAFIVEGVGYDLFPMRWERVEGLATLNESLTPLLGNCQVVYSGSDGDRRRFRTLQDTLRRNLADPAFMHQKAVDRLSQANDAWSRLVTESDLGNCRALAGDILLQLADAVAYENQTYFREGLKTQLADLKAMKRLPAGFIKEYEAVVGAGTVVQIRDMCGKLMTSSADFLSAGIETAVHPPEADKPLEEPANVDFKQLAELYGEIVSTFNKVYGCCEGDDGILAFISAVCLQHTLDNEVQGRCFDILSDFDLADLSRLCATVRSAESELVRYITGGGAAIERYASADEFIAANQQHGV